VVFYDGRMLGGTNNKTLGACTYTREIGKSKGNQIVGRKLEPSWGFAAVGIRDPGAFYRRRCTGVVQQSTAGAAGNTELREERRPAVRVRNEAVWQNQVVEQSLSVAIEMHRVPSRM
jgi:hypothetical protein